MKRLFVVFSALLVGLGLGLHAEDLAAPNEEVQPPVELFQWPVSTRIGGRKIQIVSKFGKRKVPGTELQEVHSGIDFALPEESHVRAARSGKVLFAGFSGDYVSRKDKKEKHRLIILRHEDGKSTRYVHLNRLKVKPGEEVFAG